MNRISDIQISRYLSGNMDDHESEKFMQSLEKDPALKERFRNSQILWETSLSLKKNPVTDVEAAWNDFLKRSNEPVKVTKKVFTAWRIAAGIALIALLGVLFIIVLPVDNERPQMVAVSIPAANESAPEISTGNFVVSVKDSTFEDTLDEIAPAKQKVRKKGVKQVKNVVMITVTTGDTAKAFLLPDNSIVFLNEHSSLTYPENLGKNNRKLSLTGEAYFEVRRDTMQFVVSCFNTITRGTEGSFNIKSSPAKGVEVIIAAGNVEFSGIGKKEYKKLTLLAGETGFYDLNENISKSKGYRKDYKWWNKKNLKFKFKKFFEKIRKTF